MTPDAYCREIEAYLTRKNDGHLIRIVGPSFDRVRGWAEQGIPVKVAFQGIDRHFERYYARGPRRRPVHIDHCDADVLDAFDAWRRAVGVFADRDDEGASGRRHPSLAAGIERAIARLTSLRAGEGTVLPPATLDDAVRALDALVPAARTARGEARQALLEQLARIDASLMAAARGVLDAESSGELRRQAAADLAPFRERMAADAWHQSVEAAVDRALRQKLRLPDLSAGHEH